MISLPLQIPMPVMMRMGSILPAAINGPFKSSLLALFKLAWDNKIQLPVLITVAFMAFDIRLQLEINVFWERNHPTPRHRNNQPVRRRRMLVANQNRLYAPAGGVDNNNVALPRILNPRDSDDLRAPLLADEESDRETDSSNEEVRDSDEEDDDDSLSLSETDDEESDDDDDDDTSPNDGSASLGGSGSFFGGFGRRYDYDPEDEDDDDDHDSDDNRSPPLIVEVELHQHSNGDSRCTRHDNNSESKTVDFVGQSFFRNLVSRYTGGYYY